MTRYKLGPALLLFCLLSIVIPPVIAQTDETPSSTEETSGEKGGLMNTLFKALGSVAQDALQEGIDEFIGTYKGHIGEVKFIERRGNAIVLDVKYDGVKREDGVYARGEILQWGQPLKGFKSTLSALQGKSGTVALTIGWQQGDGSGWVEQSEEQVTSDQIRLSLVRESNPDRPFGSLVYDFSKTWTTSSDIETPEAAYEAYEDYVEAEEDATEAYEDYVEAEGADELAEGEETEETQAVAAETKPARPVVMKPIQIGTILKPSQIATAKPTAASSNQKQIKVVQVPNIINSTALQQDRLGDRWDEKEGAWRGTWTRRGKTNTFDAVWTKPTALGGLSKARVTAVLTMTLSGDTVKIRRTQASDGSTCDYQGKFSQQGSATTVSGTYSCSNMKGTAAWSAVEVAK